MKRNKINIEEQRIYCVVANSIQTTMRNIIQPSGRQVAQACHSTSALRIKAHNGVAQESFVPITTIILQARDSAELEHVRFLLTKKKLEPMIFSDNNPEYGPGDWPTAVAVFATPKQVKGILDYLPLWGAK